MTRPSSALILLLFTTLAPAMNSSPAALELEAFTATDSVLAGVLKEIGGTPLSLEEAVSLSLAHAPELAQARSAVDAASGTVGRERGGFDPEFYAEVGRRGDDVPSASPFSGAPVVETDETSAGAGVRMRLPTGTEVDVSVNASRMTTNSAFASLNPQVDASGALTVRQKLLAGLGSASKKDLVSAQRALEAAEARYEAALLDVEVNVEAIYWDLYSAQRDLVVQVLSRSRGRAFLDIARLRAQAGLAGPGEVASAEVFLAEQEVLVLDARDALDRLSDRLASRVGRRPSSGEVRFRPIDDPPRVLPVPDMERTLSDALGRNRQLAALRAEEETLRSLTRAASRDRLPDVDLIGSLGGNGLSGTGQTVVFGVDTLRSSTEGSYSDAVGQVLSRDYPRWSIALQVNVPIGLREGTGERDRLRAETARAQARTADAMLRLEEAVRQQVRLLAGGQDRLQATAEGVRASREQVRIGTIAYRNGQTTAFQLVRLAADLASAERRYTTALVQTAKASAELKRLRGSGGGQEQGGRE